MKGYLDSNVLVNYLWWSKAAQKSPSKEAGAMANAIESGAFEPVVSRFCIMEVAGHFRDYEILKLLVRDGFGYRYFSQRKRNYVLPKSTERRLRKLVQVLENDRLFSVVTVERWREKAYEDIERYVEGYVDLPDAFHLQAAATAECDYFITGDDEFRQRVSAMVQRNAIALRPRMISPKEFLGLPEIRTVLGGSAPVA